MTPSPLELIAQGRFNELLALLATPAARERLLAEVGAVEAALSDARVAPTALRDRQLSLLAAGDFTWGLLTPRQRREFLVRDTRLLLGSGREDSGRAQRAALRRLRDELGNLYSALDVALREGDLDWLLPLAEHLVSVQEISGDFAAAREQYARLLETARRIGSRELELHALLGLSVAQSRLGEFGAARVTAEDAVQLASECGNQRLETAALHLAGSAAAMLELFADAGHLLGRALELRTKLADAHGEAATLTSLAYVQMMLGEREAARQSLERARGFCRELGDRRGEAMATQNLAALSYEDGLPDCAALYEGALAAYRELDEPRGVAACLSGQGFAHFAVEEFAASRTALAEAAALANNLGDSYIEGACELALGNVAFCEGNMQEAAACFWRALELADGCGNEPAQALAQAALACALSGPDPQRAATLMAAALLAQSAAGPGEALVVCLAQSACVLARQGSPTASTLAAKVLEAAEQAIIQRRVRLDPSDRVVIRLARESLGALAGSVLAQTGAAPEADHLARLAREAAAVLAGHSRP